MVCQTKADYSTQVSKEITSLTLPIQATLNTEHTHTHQTGEGPRNFVSILDLEAQNDFSHNDCMPSNENNLDHIYY